MFIQSLVSFVKEFVARVQLAIKEVEKFKELSGEEKMRRVNSVAYSFFDDNYDKIKMNFIIKAYLKKKIRNYIPEITQKIYDLIATYIEGVTNKIKNKSK